MNKSLIAAALIATVCLLAVRGSAQADPAPATQPTDQSLASSLIDAFVAGRDGELMQRASKSLKDSLKTTSLGLVRDKTIGAAGQRTGGPDKVVVSASRRVAGADGHTYEISTTVENGTLQIFFVRMVK